MPVSPPPGRPTTNSPLPLRTRVAYGFGGILDRIGTQGLKDLGNPIFNLILGINPATIGLVFVITRLWDAFADPVMGSLSDNARTRWGRRRPFMLVGTLLAAVAFLPIFWMPAGMSSGATFLWMLVTGILFFAAFTIFDIPYRALAYEIAPGSHDKTRVLEMRTIFAMLAAAVIPWIFPLAQSGWLGTPHESLPWIAGGLGLLILVSGLVVTLFVPEPADGGQSQPLVPLREGLRRTLGCWPFMRLVGMGGCTIVGVNLGFGFGSYVVIYHVFGGNKTEAAVSLGWFGTAFVGMAIVAAPLMTALAKRIGKRDALTVGLWLALAGAIGSWWAFSPDRPWGMFIAPVMMAPGLIGLWMLGESMVGDVCDVETLRTGDRSEGAFSAVFAWMLKTATALAILGSNLLLNATGFDVSFASGQNASTIWWMRIIYAGLPSIGFVASIILLAGHRLGDREMADVQAQLEKRTRTPDEND